MYTKIYKSGDLVISRDSNKLTILRDSKKIEFLKNQYGTDPFDISTKRGAIVKNNKFSLFYNHYNLISQYEDGNINICINNHNNLLYATQNVRVMKKYGYYDVVYNNLYIIKHLSFDEDKYIRNLSIYFYSKKSDSIDIIKNYIYDNKNTIKLYDKNPYVPIVHNNTNKYKLDDMHGLNEISKSHDLFLNISKIILPELLKLQNKKFWFIKEKFYE